MSNHKSWTNDVTAGAIGAVIAFPIILNCGSIVSLPLGAHHATTGITAAFGATILVSLFRAICGGSPLHMVSPKSNYAAMIAALLALVATMPSFNTAFPSPDQRIAMLIAAGFLCTALAGSIQLALGIGGLGQFVKFIPYPVIAGFINGFAVILLLAQIPPMLGVKSWSQLHLLTVGSGKFHPGTAAFGITTCVLTVWIPRFDKRVQSAIAGLVIGTGCYWILVKSVPGIELGGVIGAIPPAVPVSPQFAHFSTLVSSPAFAGLAPELLSTALTLALIASLQSLLSISANDSVLGTRHNSNQELILQGAGNFFSGIMGGIPTGGSITVNRSVLESGGRGRISNLAYGVVLLAMMAGLGKIIGMIPVPVMAGVIVATTLGQTDEWSRTLLRLMSQQKRGQWSGELVINFCLVTTVAVMVVAFGVFPALIAGMVLAFIVFVRHSSQNVIRRTISGVHIRSRTSRPAASREALNLLAGQMAVIEVQGAIFFGSSDQLAQHLELSCKGIRIIIVDLKRATGIDSSGVVTLERIDKALTNAGCQLLLAHVAPDSPLQRSLCEMGFARVIQQGRALENLDLALSAAEELLLKDANSSIPDELEYPFEEFDILKGISSEDLACLSLLMVRIELPAGGLIVREGESSDSIFLLASGRVSVTRAISGRTIRFASYCPGICFGEIGMLTGRLRSADVRAETAVACWQLSGDTFRELSKSNPEMVQEMLKNISIGLADLVFSLSDMVKELEQ